VTPPATPPRRGLRGLGVAIFTAIAQLLAALPGQTTDDGVAASWLVFTVPITVASTAVLFGVIVPRADARTAVLLAVVAAVSLLVFRFGVTLPLAAAAMVIARDVPSREPDESRRAVLALVVAILTMAVVAWFALVDAFDAIDRLRE
jgi:Voltage-dependent anion channel